MSRMRMSSARWYSVVASSVLAALLPAESAASSGVPAKSANGAGGAPVPETIAHYCDADRPDATIDSERVPLSVVRALPSTTHPLFKDLCAMIVRDALPVLPAKLESIPSVSNPVFAAYDTASEDARLMSRVLPFTSTAGSAVCHCSACFGMHQFRLRERTRHLQTHGWCTLAALRAHQELVLKAIMDATKQPSAPGASLAGTDTAPSSSAPVPSTDGKRTGDADAGAGGSKVLAQRTMIDRSSTALSNR